MTPARLYHFGRFRLDGDAHLLFRDESRIPLTTLGAPFIETIPKRGYRFVGAVEERQADSRILLAVLPFGNLSGGAKDDAFSDGLTEEMITQLGRLNPTRLGVIARTSAMTYKSTAKTIDRIGRELGVSYVLEGSARRAGNRVRIAAQLIKVSDQTHLWAESYEGSLEDILTLQSSVSREVAKQIQVKLLRSENPRQVVPAAYEAYLKGRYLWNQRTERDLRSGIRCFEEAIRSDPAYAPPYAGIADSYLTLMDHGYLPLSEAIPKARPMVRKALDLDAHLTEAHVSLGHAAFHEFDWRTAGRELLRGIELNPSYSIARRYYANYLAAMWRLEEALVEAEESKRLDPVSLAAHSNLASILWFAGLYERSIEQVHETLELNPGYPREYEALGRCHEQMGALDRAIEAFEKAASVEKHAFGALASLAHAYALAGREYEATKILRRLQRTAKTEFVSAHNFVLVYVGLGKKEEAFEWLDKAYDERSGALPFLSVNPRFNSLRRDPRFEKLLGRVGLPAAEATRRSSDIRSR